MADYKLIPGKYPQKPTNTENEFFKSGWSIRKENDKYYMSYISGSLQGELKLVEISNDDFVLAKDDKITLDELCIKYNVN